MALQGSAGGPPYGWAPEGDCSRVYNRTGGSVLKGAVLQLDLGQTATESTDNLIGSETSGFAAVVAPVSGQLQEGIFCIALEGAAANALMKVQFAGIVDALVGGADAAALYEPLTALATDQVLTSEAPAANSKVLGLATTVTAAGADELVEILFDGLHGFGNNS